jgi:hypothetical protein
VTTESFTEFPTMNFRQVWRMVRTPEGVTPEGQGYGWDMAPGLVLQQAWQRDDHTVKWRDVPIEGNP